MMQQKAKLIIFDIDGTLADRDTDELLPGVMEFFDRYATAFNIALATNQGGVGMRHWMERDGFGKPEEFPTEDQARAHVLAVQDQLMKGQPIPYYICFAYQSKKSGQWSPLPEGISPEDPEWRADHRKPAPGMLIRAMRDAQAQPTQTIMVGDSEEDEQAAKVAGCSFQWADDFFKRRSELENG